MACLGEATAFTPLLARTALTALINLFMFLLFLPKSATPQFEVEDTVNQEVPGGVSVIWMAIFSP